MQEATGNNKHTPDCSFEPSLCAVAITIWPAAADEWAIRSAARWVEVEDAVDEQTRTNQDQN